MAPLLYADPARCVRTFDDQPDLVRAEARLTRDMIDIQRVWTPKYDGAVLYPHSMDYLRDFVAEDHPLVLRPIDSAHCPQREEAQLLIRMIEQFMDESWQKP